MNIEISGEWKKYVHELTGSGRFKSSEEVIKVALLLMQQIDKEDQEEFEKLKGAIQEGIDDPISYEYSMDEIMKEFQNK